jgi:tRNA pseudouridine synthase
MVAVLFMVGRHLEAPQIIVDLLDTSKVPAKPIYEMASEIPLVLYDCGYEDLHWSGQEAEGEGASADVMRRLVCHYESICNELLLKSRVVGLMLDATKSSSLATALTKPYLSLNGFLGC